MQDKRDSAPLALTWVQVIKHMHDSAQVRCAPRKREIDKRKREIDKRKADLVACYKALIKDLKREPMKP